MTIILGAFQTMNPNGTIGASWRHPENTSLGYLTIDYWTKLARTLEEANFDFLFFADSYGYPTVDGETIPTAVTDAMYVPMADPITIVTAIAAATERLGIVVTSSTTVEKPATVARRYGTLDHFTNGRIGWNVVTGAAQSSSADLFGEVMIPHDERYAQADDHISICLKLWEGSWADDALRLDAEAGVFADPRGVRQIEHEGKYLRARGLYNLPPSPQRTPLILQAGTSLAGREFAATYAEVVFIGGGDPAQIAGQISDIRARAVGKGRRDDSIKFLVGAHFVAGATSAEAAAKRLDMVQYATLEQAATTYAWVTGINLLSLELDEPMPDLHTEQGQSSVDRFMNPVSGQRQTVREVLTEFRDKGINGTIFVGDGETIADEVEALIAATGADGFLVQPHITPGAYSDFATYVIPQFVSRGLVAPSAEPTTLRKRMFPGGDDLLPDEHVGSNYRTVGVRRSPTMR